MKKQLLVLMLACGACFVSTTEATNGRGMPFGPPTAPKVSGRGPKFLKGLEEELSPAFEAGEAVNPTPYLMAIIQTLQSIERAVGMTDNPLATSYNLRHFRRYNSAAKSGRRGMSVESTMCAPPSTVRSEITQVRGEYKKELEEEEAASRISMEKRRTERQREDEERRKRISEEHRKSKEEYAAQRQ